MVSVIRTFSVTVLIIAAWSLPAGVYAQGYPGGQREAYGDRFGPQAQTPSPHRHTPPAGANAFATLRHWNEVALHCNALDHTPVAPDEHRIFGEQLGPARTSRALAIVHIAIADAISAIAGEFDSYTGIAYVGRGASLDAAIAQATHDTLVALFPSQSPGLDQVLADDLGRLPDGASKTAGIQVGARAAAAILALRANDRSYALEPRLGVDFFPSNDPGKWRQDPISLIPLALGAHWGEVQPFVISSPRQFRSAPPPRMNSAEYAKAYDEVKRLGGDGIVTPTDRTPEQTLIALYWAYDGTAGLGTPPRLYNQIAVQIATEKHLDVGDLARLLALVNVSLADTAIVAWETKYYYQFWRPVTAIRESDAGTGPTALGDGNAATIGDPTYTPLSAPASNLMGPNFTPPFPAYVSGHAAFGGAFFETLRKFFRTDSIAFTFVSDELNGETRDNSGNVRPLVPRSFESLSEAEEENGQSRIYLGIHWAFDKTAGIEQGRRIANHVFNGAFASVHGRDKDVGRDATAN